MNEFQIQQQTREKNRKKLIQQNLRLHAQLTKLQTEIQSLEEHLSRKTEQQPHITALKTEIQIQERQIKQLKEAVDAGRQSNAKQNVYYIKKEEDELLFVKQELQTLIKEKEVVALAHQDKVRRLAGNQPLQRHKEEIQRNWNETKKENREMSLKIVELQREIRRFHAMKESSKSSTPNGTNEEMEYATIEGEIARMNAEMKLKQMKWRPNGQVLDSEYFTNRSTLQTLQKKVEELEKEEGIWRGRAAALRDQSEIQIDRERLSKIVTMVKPQPIIKIPSTPKEVVIKPTLEMLMQKQIRNNIKNDKFVDLVRISSTPSAGSSIKKSIQLQPIQLETKKERYVEAKVKDQGSKAKKERVQSPSQHSNIKKSDSLNFSAKRERSEQESQQRHSPKDVKPIQVAQQNKNGHNWLGRREKIKSKQANSVALAEMIKQKAEEVKKMNQKLEKQQQIQRSVSSPKKKRDKSSMERVETYSQLDGKRSKIKIHKQIPSSLEEKKEVQNQKNTKESVTIKGSLEPKQMENSTDKKKPAKQMKTPKQKKEENLVQNIDLSSKLNSLPMRSISKSQKISNSKINEQPIKLPSQKSKQQQQIRQQIKPSSPKSKQTPIFQIFISDKPKVYISASPASISQSPSQQTDGIPKIIRRKRVLQGEQVTTGTST